MIGREEGEEDEGEEEEEPAARHLGVVEGEEELPFPFSVDLAVFSATLDSGFPRIAIRLMSLRFQWALRTSSATGG